MDAHKRKHIRLRGYDYAQNGVYFVTICTYEKQHRLGHIAVPKSLSDVVFEHPPECVLSRIGVVAQTELLNLPNRFPGVYLDAYVIMPNHIHALFIIDKTDIKDQPRQEQSPCPTIADILCAFKSITTKTVNANDKTPGRKLWQFRYYDHIVRGEEEYLGVLQYIQENPAKWQDDCYF